MKWEAETSVPPVEFSVKCIETKAHLKTHYVSLNILYKDRAFTLITCRL